MSRSFFDNKDILSNASEEEGVILWCLDELFPFKHSSHFRVSSWTWCVSFVPELFRQVKKCHPVFYFILNWLILPSIVKYDGKEESSSNASIDKINLRKFCIWCSPLIYTRTYNHIFAIDFKQTVLEMKIFLVIRYMTLVKTEYMTFMSLFLSCPFI